MNLFVANIGNRDVGVNFGTDKKPVYCYFDKGSRRWDDIIKKLSLSERGMRHVAESVNRNFSSYKQSLIAPILFPALDFALKKVEEIDVLILLVTNNLDKNEHWHWDTIESGKLLQKMIDSNAKLKRKILKTEIVEVQNPNFYDDAYESIGKELAGRFEKAKVEKVFASISGGVPAMNSALQSQIIDRFGAKSVLLQTKEPPQDKKEKGILGKPEKLENWRFRRTAVLRIIRTLLDRYDYEGVLILLEQENINDRVIRALCAHAKARFNFDFDDATKELSFLTAHNFPQDWKETAATHLSLQRISELAFTGQILFNRRDFVGFVTRTASLHETALSLIAKTVTGKSIGGKVDKFSRVKMIEKDLENIKTEAELPKKRCVEDLIQQIAKLDDLSGLRNQSLHRGKGINMAQINKAFPNCERRFSSYTETLVEKLKEMERLYGRESSVIETEYIYREIGKTILQQLESI